MKVYSKNGLVKIYLILESCEPIGGWYSGRYYTNQGLSQQINTFWTTSSQPVKTLKSPPW